MLSFWIAVAVVVVLTTVDRLHQHVVWKRAPERHFVAGSPLVTSADAYLWLRFAEDWRDGRYDTRARDPLRSFPDGADRPRPAPLLSVILGLASRVAGVPPAAAGVYVVAGFAGLFVLPLALYFRHLGMPAAGVLGGLVTAFSHEYLPRTSVGGVDTDALNLFFPLLASLLVLLAPGSRLRVVVCSASAGLTMLLFFWWYFKPGFTVVYLGVLVLHLALAGVGSRTVAAGAAAFVLASNPLYLWRGVVGLGSFVSSYFLGTAEGTRGDTFVLPNLLSTVSEAQRLDPRATVALVLDPPLPVFVGLALFVLCAGRYRRSLVPLLPLVALGLLSFRGGRRFVVFLAPLVGIGFGYGVHWLAERRFRRRKAATGSANPSRGRLAIIWAGATAVAVVLFPFSAADFVPAPRIAASTATSFLELREVLPDGAAMLTWWDYGYALAALGGFATFHDGSYQGLTSFLVARALSSARQEELYSVTAFLTELGPQGAQQRLSDAADPERVLTEAATHDHSLGRDDVFVLLIDPMISKYAAIHYLGQWDVRHGSGVADGYQTLRCQRWENHVIECDDMTIDTRTGEIRADLTLDKLVVLGQGRVLSEREFGTGTGVYLQVVTGPDGVTGLHLLKERVFRSNFNRMYFLGDYDRSRFEEIDTGIAGTRVFRVRPHVLGRSPSAASTGGATGNAGGDGRGG